MAAKKKVRVGIIGTGIGNAHRGGFDKLDNVEIIGLVDLDEKRGKAVAKEWEVPNSFTNHEDLLNLKGLDAVTVGTPNAFHASVAIDALKAGKHVMCEKPMAATLAEAEKLAKIAKKSDKVFMMGFNNRYRGDTTYLKKIIDSGELGEMYYGKTGWVRRHGAPGAGGWFTTKALSGGGPLIDLGVHALDLTWWLMGKPKPVSVDGSVFYKLAKGEMERIGAKGTYDVEDAAVAHVRFENGAAIMIEASWILHIPKEQFYCSISGTEGGATVEPDFRIVQVKLDQPVDVTPQAPSVNGHEAEIAHFVDCIITGREPISTADDGLNVQKMLDGIYRSSETGTIVTL